MPRAQLLRDRGGAGRRRGGSRISHPSQATVPAGSSPEWPRRARFSPSPHIIPLSPLPPHHLSPYHPPHPYPPTPEDNPPLHTHRVASDQSTCSLRSRVENARSVIRWRRRSVRRYVTHALLSHDSPRRLAMFLAMVEQSMSCPFNSGSFGSQRSPSSPGCPSTSRVAVAVASVCSPAPRGPDPLVGRRSRDGGHAGIPAAADLDVGRQAGFVHQAFGVGDRPLVERGDAGASASTKPSSSASGSARFT